MPTSTSKYGIYTFRFGGRSIDIGATSPNAAAARFARSKGFPGTITTVAGLLHHLVETGWHATMLDPDGETVGVADPDARSVVVYPPLE